MTTPTQLNRFIDHTLLKPETSMMQIEKHCAEARKFEFWSVCINPVWVAHAKDLLEESQVKICTVIGFPLGANRPETKADETKRMIDAGADEIDMVLSVGLLKSGDFEGVHTDIYGVVRAAQGRLVKVILETCLLTDEEKTRASEIALAAGAQFLKTSTGMAAAGATESDVKLLRKIAGKDFGVKASGGIRDQATAIKMIEAGASRLGTSNSIAIVSGEKGSSSY